MKVGDYVRNKYGIAKVIDIENNNGIDIFVFDKPICFLVNKETGEIKDNRLLNRLAIIDVVDISKIKSSPNIIDLIEENDFINGMRITQIISNKNGVLECMKDSDYEFITTITNNEVKSVLTHEQFENMEYKIGE